MSTSSSNLRAAAVIETGSSEHTEPRGERALELLQAAHPDLLSALQEHVADKECTLNVSALPRHSRQLLWNLYQLHDPDLAEWMRAVAPARQSMDATLCLHARDILRFLEIEAEDLQVKAPVTPP